MKYFYRNFKDFLRSLSPQVYNQADRHKIIVKYLVSGATAVSVDLCLLYIFTDILGVWYLFSAGLAFTVSFFVSFSLQKFWTFRDNNKGKVYQQMSLYFVVGVVNLFLNTGGIYLLVDRFKVWYLLAQVIATAILGVGSFLIYKFIIFKKQKRQDKRKIEGNLKILIATGIFPPDIGGPATYVKMLCEELPKLGCDVKVVTYASQKSKEAQKPELEIFNVSRKQNILFRYFKYFRQMRKLSNWADVVYAHDLVSVGLPCALAKFLKPRTKLVVRLGGDFLWEKAYNNNWTDKPLSSYYQEPKNFKEKIYLVIYKFVLNKCEKIIFSTSWQKDIYEKYLNINSDKTAIINNAFLKSNPISKDDITLNNKNILFAGRLIRLKNLETILKVVEQLKEINLIIVGEGPEKKNLEILAKKLGVNNRVNFKSKMVWPELNKEILDSFLVLVPSITDISPNLVLECIKLNKPVLVTKEGGFYDKYRDKLIFIDPFSQEDIRESIARLLDKNNYNNYLNKIKSIDTSREKSDLALDHYNFFKNL